MDLTYRILIKPPGKQDPYDPYSRTYEWLWTVETVHHTDTGPQYATVREGGSTTRAAAEQAAKQATEQHPITVIIDGQYTHQYYITQTR